MNLKTGLCSITFRQLSVDEIIALVKKASLDGIEWGGDIHVPHGDLNIARQVAQKCREANIAVSSYGSYYKSGTNDSLSFQTVAETARALGAPMIRIWAGNLGSDSATTAERKKIIDDLIKCDAIASEMGVQIGLERHGNTLTDTTDSINLLISELSQTNIKFYWQPDVGADPLSLLPEIKIILPKLANFHVFHWEKTEVLQKLPLANGINDWNMFFECANKLNSNHWALMEFVAENEPQQFIDDAATLNQLTAPFRK